MVQNLVLVLLSLLLVNCTRPNEFKGDKPIVVITFDDADYSIYQTAFPKMSALNYSATHFLPASYPSQGDNSTVEQLQEMELFGWETGGHGITHANLSATTLDSAKMAIDSSYSFLKSNNLSTKSYAYAFGNYSPDLITYTKTVFDNIRTSHDMLYLNGVDREELGYFAVLEQHSSADLIHRVERAKMEGSQLVVIGFHALRSVEDVKPDFYWCKTEIFDDLLEYLSENGYRVETVSSAMELLFE
jgi:peptidoglycan/xylan/chitin deacetylase (PgdA/CDA1 family)